MSDETRDHVEIEPISDAELEGVAGGAIIAPDQDGSSNGCCTCSGNNCSLAEPTSSS